MCWPPGTQAYTYTTLSELLHSEPNLSTKEAVQLISQNVQTWYGRDTTVSSASGARSFKTFLHLLGKQAQRYVCTHSTPLHILLHIYSTFHLLLTAWGNYGFKPSNWISCPKHLVSISNRLMGSSQLIQFYLRLLPYSCQHSGGTTIVVFFLHTHIVVHTKEFNTVFIYLHGYMSIPSTQDSRIITPLKLYTLFQIHCSKYLVCVFQP